MEGSEDWFTRAMQMQTQTQMEMEASSHVQRNARKERYTSAVKVFFEDGRHGLSFCRFTRVGSERKYWLKKMCHFGT